MKSFLKNKDLKEVKVLEEIFLDQLNFKISALFAFRKFSKTNFLELKSFINELRNITYENLNLLDKENAPTK